MPGLTLWLAPGQGPVDRTAFAEAQRLMLHAPDYVAADWSRDGLAVGYVGYPQYPIRRLEFGDRLAIIEGRIYNKSGQAVDDEVRGLADVALGEGPGRRERLASWICGTEGEYVVLWAAPAARHVVAVTDPFGRLPLYYYADRERLLLAREGKFVQRLKARPSLDRLGMAEVLWLAWPLGERTLFEDVRRTPPALLLEARAAGGAVLCRTSALYTFNFDETEDPPPTVREAAGQVVENLVAAARQWGGQPDVRTHVLSLSGGQDSRAIAAALARAGVPFEAVSIWREPGPSRRDAPRAKEVAARLGAPWHLIELPSNTLEDYLAQVRLREGLNTAGMGIMRGYARQIVERWGRGALFITGEAGDKILPDLPLGQRCRSLEALVEAIDGEFAKVPADRAAAMLGLDAEALRADLADRLGSFPETQAGRKAAHFLIFELHGKSAFEGEDRTRASLWSTTPFFSFRFFRHAMRLPDRLKRDRRLYRRVQVLLSPACAQVSDTTIGLAPSSVLFGPKVKVKRWLFHVFPPGLRWQVRNLIRGAPPPYDASPAMRERIRASLAETDGLGAMLDPHAVETFLGACSQAQFEYFMTVVLLDHLWRTEWSAREVARASSP